MNRTTTTIPLRIDLSIEVPYGEYVEKINEAVNREIEGKSAEILDQIRLFVSASVDQSLENRVALAVGQLVEREVRSAISSATVERAAKSALKKATANAVALALGHKIHDDE